MCIIFHYLAPGAHYFLLFLTRGYCVAIHELLGWWDSLTHSLTMVLAILRTLIGSVDHVHTSWYQYAGLNEVTTVSLGSVRM